ncbi:Uncharacterized protein TCM_022902 [Theobroma cacao]|uniref:Uncharacterized protein n=1 Tax=Theobroma cacao TaxID=3641 RepID=A0A061EVK3_THECC|nr:Uncharacterized protein TCM_022902 [Theobroma cacao]
MPNFETEKESSIVPIWISFPNLKAHLFEKLALLLIVKAIGNPLYVDKATTNGTWPSVARFCIEYDCLKAPLNSVWIVVSKRGLEDMSGGYLHAIMEEDLEEQNQAPKQGQIEVSSAYANEIIFSSKSGDAAKCREGVVVEIHGDVTDESSSPQKEVTGCHREMEEEQSTGAESMHVISELNGREKLAIFFANVQTEKGEVQEHFHEQGKFTQTGYDAKERGRTEPEGGKPQMAPAIGNFEVQDKRDKQKSASGTSIKMATLASDGTSHAWRQEGAGINFNNNRLEPLTQAATRLHGDEQTRTTMRELPLGSAASGPNVLLEVHVQGKKGQPCNGMGERDSDWIAIAEHDGTLQLKTLHEGAVRCEMSTVADGIMAQDSMQARIGGKEAKIGAARNQKKKKIKIKQKLVDKAASSVEKIENGSGGQNVTVDMAEDKAVDRWDNDEASDEDAISVNFAASWECEKIPPSGDGT